MNKTEINLFVKNIGPHNHDSKGEFWDEHIKLWSQVETVINGHRISVTLNNTPRSYDITVDCTKLIQQLYIHKKFDIGFIELFKKSESEQKEFFEKIKINLEEPIFIKFLIVGEDRIRLGLFESFLQDLFIAINLSIPGAFDLIYSHYTINNEETKQPIFFSSYKLESAWFEAIGWGWPELPVLPFV